ncbi:MAG TPA: hypothetical protein VKG89_01570 [Solirubrobacterales bacterium]|nr:hypothetical protein [Solirubrobacterales bacterium]
MLRVAGLPTRLGAALMLSAALGAGLLLSGCNTNPEDTTSVAEGEAMKVGELLYNVQITRYLNPSDPEDKAYLTGQPALSPNQYYLGVFMQIQNESGSAQPVPARFTVTDTEGHKFKPIQSHSLFALKLGGNVAGDGALPVPESTAADGPIQGSMVLFRITGSAIEARPLTLDIPSTTGSAGHVELDI